MVMGAPLEDARHLAQRYDRMRQEAEAQVIFTMKHAILNFFLVFFPPYGLQKIHYLGSGKFEI
jgi:hypothetical protein